MALQANSIKLSYAWRDSGEAAMQKDPGLSRIWGPNEASGDDGDDDDDSLNRPFGILSLKSCLSPRPGLLGRSRARHFSFVKH